MTGKAAPFVTGIRTREFRCPQCGYGAVAAHAPERCPMCGSTRWQELDGSRSWRMRVGGRAHDYQKEEA